jgi:hypothetical protein
VAVQIAPLRLAHHGDLAVIANANVAHEAIDLKQVGQRDRNEVTLTKHGAQAEAVRKHHQNPVVLVEALKKADAALARIANIAMSDRKLVKVVQVADDREWIAVQDIVPLKLLSEVPAAGDPILMLTHGTMAQVIDDLALAHQGVITDRSSVQTAVTSAMVDPTLDIMLADMAVIIPGLTHDMVRCTTVDSDHRAVIPDHNSVRIVDTSVTVDPTSDIMPVAMAVTTPGLTHDMAQCTTMDLAHKDVITVRSSVHTADTSATVDTTSDIMPVAMAVTTPGLIQDIARCITADLAHKDVITVRSSVHTADTSATVDTTSDIMPVAMAVTTPGLIQDIARCITADLAHRAVITVRSSVHTADTSDTVDPTLDIMPADMAIISVPILVHDMVAQCLDIISVHEMATTHISAHAV